MPPRSFRSTTFPSWLSAALLIAPAVGVPAAGLAVFFHARSAPGATVRRSPSPSSPPIEGLVLYDVRDAKTGAPIPCKLVFEAEGGGPGPLFTVDDIGMQEGDAIAARDRVMSASGTGYARVPAGTWDVAVSRGPEWDLQMVRHVVVGAGASVRLAARLTHVVDTTGWVSADFHVHAAMSSDSGVPMRDRVYQFLADGVDVITATDHNVIADYGPIIQSMGVGDAIASLAGDEVTTDGWGHFGAFPLTPRFGRVGEGAVLVAGRTPARIFGDLREGSPAAIIDVHHPREHGIGYFESGGFDSESDYAARFGYSGDFDALEVLNGYQDANRSGLDRVLHDWFQLLLHGHVVTATGNSDTHRLDGNVGGYPRNFLRVPDDAPAHVTGAAIADAVRAHRSFFTTGPFVRLLVDGHDLGETCDARAGAVTVEVEVDAAPWVSVSQVVLYLSGREVARWPVAPSTTVARFRRVLRLPVAADGFVVARVEGDRPLDPVVGNRGDFTVWPMAVTNPVFLDHDGNGVYDAPLAPGPPPGSRARDAATEMSPPAARVPVRLPAGR